MGRSVGGCDFFGRHGRVTIDDGTRIALSSAFTPDSHRGAAAVLRKPRDSHRPEECPGGCEPAGLRGRSRHFSRRGVDRFAGTPHLPGRGLASDPESADRFFHPEGDPGFFPASRLPEADPPGEVRVYLRTGGGGIFRSAPAAVAQDPPDLRHAIEPAGAVEDTPGPRFGGLPEFAAFLRAVDGP